MSINKLKNTMFPLIACALLGCQTGEYAENIVIIDNITAIDAINGLKESVDIVIVGDKIKKVGMNAGDETYNGEITVIDGAGKYIIPGLWDAHVHLSYDDNIGYEVFFPLSIAHGVTSLRDTGGHLEKLSRAREIADTDPTVPDLYVSGPLLDGERRVYDGSSAGFPDLSVGISTEQTARDYVDELAEQGVSFVKAYEMLSPEVFAAIGNQAARHNLPMAAHIPLSMTVEQAVASGVKDMQHLRNIELSCASNVEELLASRQATLATSKGISNGKLRSDIHSQQRAIALPHQDSKTCNALINLLADQDVYQTPTLTITRFLTLRLYGEDFWRDTFDYMPPSIAEGWKTRSKKLLELPISDGAQAYDDWVLDTLPKLSAAGVPIMAGTDAPIAYLTPGASLLEEMILLGDAGLTEMQVLKSATYTPARFLGLENRLGTIDEGKTADLVILKGNPLSDMQNIKQIDAVIKNGFVLDRAELNNRLSEPSRL